MRPSRLFVDKWSTRKRHAPGRLDILPDVVSPELGNRRDILVYLPASYERSDRSYPVIYMHDGQNLFDARTSFAGDWGVDVAMARAPRAGRRAIVVGIPNMGTDRMREYSPFDDKDHGGGAGDLYLDFIVQTLKPMIDARYRTRPDAAGTGILGSSLGGLISLYAFFRRPGQFGFAGVMSPALWFADRAIFHIAKAAGHVGGKLYLDVGTREGAGTLANAREMRDVLVANGYVLGNDLMWVEEEGGMHNEAAWGRRLRKALPFLVPPEDSL